MTLSATPIVGVVGCGVTGSRVVAGLVAAEVRVAVFDIARVATRSIAHGGKVVTVAEVDDLAQADVVVLCQPTPHAELARHLLALGTAVVSIGDDVDDLRLLLGLDQLARLKAVPVIVGAGMAPGLSGLFARFLAPRLHHLDELHVAIHGTAGPACAEQHHDALGERGLGWHDGEWIEPAGGTGRDLVWFPEPVGAHDCYRAALGDPLLLHLAFPDVQRIAARVSATRRDRLTARLPMLLPPHPSGDLGAVRVEARGAAASGERVTLIAGSAGMTSDLAAAVCVTVTRRLLAGAGGGMQHGGVPPGVHALGDEALDPLDVLQGATELGVRVQEFTGVARATSW